MSIRHRQDSIKELKNRRTLEELSTENEKINLRKDRLEREISSLQIAICEVYEAMNAGTPINKTEE